MAITALGSNHPTARRTLMSVVVGFLVLVAVAFGPASPAAAEAGDRISQYDIDYTVNADGSVDVVETITYVFNGYARHGIYRQLLVRTPYDKEQDRLYDISGFDVSSPTGAATSYTTSQQYADNGRTIYNVYKIGSADRTVKSVETYVLKYRVDGVLNAQENADTEFYWNATGNNWDAEIENVAITVSAPGGVHDILCFAGPRGSDNSCTSASVSDGKAHFTNQSINSGEEWGITIVVGMDPTKVDATKDLVAPPTMLNQNGFTPVNMGVGAALLAGMSLLAVRYRRQGRDMRFVGVPPGVVPSENELRARGNGIGQVADDGSIEPPVAFSPPRGVTPAEASHLRRPGPGPDQLAATILSLADRGALAVEGDGDTRVLRLLDRGVATARHEQAFIDRLFDDTDTVELTEEVPPGVNPPLHQPSRSHDRALADTVRKRKWFVQRIGTVRGHLKAWSFVLIGAGLAGLAYSLFLWVSTRSGAGLGIWALLGLIGGILLLIIARTGEGEGRTAVGRAVMDQIEGFELYLRTAEAEQLRFEEGEDIFSKYLPWAVVFDITKRWTRVCAELSAAGLIPSQPSWYYGHWDPLTSYIWISSLNHSIGSAAAPPTPIPTAGGGGTGGGSGFSGFGGGGFSGGGGGGGGGGSW